MPPAGSTQTTPQYRTALCLPGPLTRRRGPCSWGEGAHLGPGRCSAKSANPERPGGGTDEHLLNSNGWRQHLCFSQLSRGPPWR
eukprot:4040905-Alexandrium_andersonii.AAC.1